jgi:hypothetical protein
MYLFSNYNSYYNSENVSFYLFTRLNQLSTPLPSMVSGDTIIARVEDLERVCPGNALLWEFLQLKTLKRSELKERVYVMLDRQHEFRSTPGYIGRVHRDGFDSICRRKIVKLYLEVRSRSEEFLLRVGTQLFFP